MNFTDDNRHFGRVLGRAMNRISRMFGIASGAACITAG